MGWITVTSGGDIHDPQRINCNNLCVCWTFPLIVRLSEHYFDQMPWNLVPTFIIPAKWTLITLAFHLPPLLNQMFLPSYQFFSILVLLIRAFSRQHCGTKRLALLSFPSFIFLQQKIQNKIFIQATSAILYPMKSLFRLTQICSQRSYPSLAQWKQTMLCLLRCLQFSEWKVSKMP